MLMYIIAGMQVGIAIVLGYILVVLLMIVG